MVQKVRWLGMVMGWLVVGSVGCSGSDDDGGVGAGGGSAGSHDRGGSAGTSIAGRSGGTAGSLPTGGATSGNAGAGGSGSGTCIPNPKVGDFGDFNNCLNYDFSGGGILADGVVDLASYPLQEDLRAGVNNAISLESFGTTLTVELWGTNSNCGPAVEKLASRLVSPGPQCFDFTPAASYPEVLVVVRNPGSGSLSGYVNLQFCSGGRCR